MAIVTLTLTDVDLATGAYKCDYSVREAKTDDGKVTAAHMTGKFLSMQVPQAAFREGAEQFGDRLISSLEEGGPLVFGTQKETLTLTLTDADLKTGRYSAKVSGTDKRDGSASIRPTAAQITGYYMRSLLNDSQFVLQVWAFADELVKNNSTAMIENNEHAPGVIFDPNSQAAQIAA